MAHPVPHPPIRRPLPGSEVLTLATAGDTRAETLDAARAKAVAWFGHDDVTMRNARVKPGTARAWVATSWWSSTRPEVQP